MTIFNWQSNLRGLFGNRLRGTCVIAFGIVGWALFAGCAGELDPNQDYCWAYNPGTPGSCAGSGNAQGGSGNAQGGMTGSGGSTVTVPQDPPCLQPLMNAQCTVCHGPSADLIGGNLDLRGPNLGQSMLNKPSVCNTNPALIDGANPDNSTFLKKVSNQPTGCGGTAMPQGSTGLMGADLTCIQNWMTSFKH